MVSPPAQGAGGPTANVLKRVFSQEKDPVTVTVVTWKHVMTFR